MSQRDRLQAKYGKLLALHNRYRLSVSTWLLAMRIEPALAIVRERIAELDQRRLAA